MQNFPLGLEDLLLLTNVAPSQSGIPRLKRLWQISCRSLRGLARVLSSAAPLTVPLMRYLMLRFVDKPEDRLLVTLFEAGMFRTVLKSSDPSMLCFDFLRDVRTELIYSTPARTQLDVILQVDLYWSLHMPNFCNMKELQVRCADPTLQLSQMNFLFAQRVQSFRRSVGMDC
jgi:hypothetical protein